MDWGINKEGLYFFHDEKIFFAAYYPDIVPWAKELSIKY